MKKEIITMLKLQSEFVVDYNTSWSENNRIFIQMEFCQTDLSKIIDNKEKAFLMQTKSLINPLDYFISTELLIELLEAVNYLHHKVKPPIIHRDLKPQNILITVDSINNRFMKIADFGISAIHEETMKHTTGWGTDGYRAPEVLTGRYDTRADIFSVGMIAQTLIFYNL